MKSLLALQTELDAIEAVELTKTLKAKSISPTRPLPTPHQVAKELMSGIRAKRGTAVQWPMPWSRQKYAPMVRATRIMLERMIQNKELVMEGTPRGNEIRVENHKRCYWHYEKCHKFTYHQIHAVHRLPALPGLRIHQESHTTDNPTKTMD